MNNNKKFALIVQFLVANFDNSRFFLKLDNLFILKYSLDLITYKRLKYSIQTKSLASIVWSLIKDFALIR